MIIRIYLALMRLHKKTKDPSLLHLIHFLRAYVPLLVLLGVSSAQINAAPKDIVSMGAHENTILMPLKQFLDELIRYNPEAVRWQEELLRDDPETQDAYKRSGAYSALVLEGTGILEPVMAREEAIKARIVLESLMPDEDVFYALRRSYYYDKKNTSFYKTVEKIFTPTPILAGGSFGSFLILQRRPNVPERAQLPLSQQVTKSVSFSDFISNKPNVCMLMEAELTAAEQQAIFEGMHNIHPPVPLLPPSTPAAARQTKCRELIETQFRRRVNPVLQTVIDDRELMTQIYYWRSGSITAELCRKVATFLNTLPAGMLQKYELKEEWVTDDVGGYRLAVSVSRAHVDRLWSQNEKRFAKKLPLS